MNGNSARQVLKDHGFIASPGSGVLYVKGSMLAHLTADGVSIMVTSSGRHVDYSQLDAFLRLHELGELLTREGTSA